MNHWESPISDIQHDALYLLYEHEAEVLVNTTIELYIFSIVAEEYDAH